jgi:hypothetical protein
MVAPMEFEMCIKAVCSGDCISQSIVGTICDRSTHQLVRKRFGSPLLLDSEHLT